MTSTGATAAPPADVAAANPLAAALRAAAGGGGQGQHVDEKQKQLEDDEKKHELAAALREGVRKMRALAMQGRYMFPNPGELELVELESTANGARVLDQQGNTVRAAGRAITVFQLRLERSCLPNPWADSIRNTSRIPFRASIRVDGWDDELQGTYEKDADTGTQKLTKPGWVADIDGEGRTLDEWAVEAFEDSLFEGVVYALVDNDSRTIRSTADRIAAKARPWVSKLRRENFRRIVVETQPGKPPRLLQISFAVPLKLTDIDDPDNWSDEDLQGYKVITAGDPEAPKNDPRRKVRVSFFIKDSKGNIVPVPELGGTITPDNPQEELLEIPLIPLYTKRTGPWRGECPFLDAAEIQLSIWNAVSEWLNKMREAAISIVHESGVRLQTAPNAAQAPVLPDTRNMRYRWSTDPQARLTINEQSGSSLAAIGAGIDKLINWVEQSLHQVQSERPTAPVTAREITLQGVHATSALDMWVSFQEAGWTKILSMMALLGGLPKRGDAAIPHDFGLPSAALPTLTQLFMADKLTAKNYWNEARSAGQVDDAFDVQLELKLEADAKAKADQAGGPGFGGKAGGGSPTADIAGAVTAARAAQLDS